MSHAGILLRKHRLKIYCSREHGGLGHLGGGGKEDGIPEMNKRHRCTQL